MYVDMSDSTAEFAGYFLLSYLEFLFSNCIGNDLDAVVAFKSSPSYIKKGLANS